MRVVTESDDTAGDALSFVHVTHRFDRFEVCLGHLVRVVTRIDLRGDGMVRYGHPMHNVLRNASRFGPIAHDGARVMTEPGP